MTEPTFLCTSCGETALQWAGQCRVCGEWNSLKPWKAPPSVAKKKRLGGAGPQPLQDINLDAANTRRLQSGLSELDRVLGGGWVADGVVLLGGDPGIGKSTLLTQVQALLAVQGLTTLYVTAEESAQQVAQRAARLQACVSGVEVLATTDLDEALACLDKRRPNLLVIDSIQTVAVADVASSPGSVVQVKACCQRLVAVAKQQGVAVCLIGHVTKEGSLAGPRILEHMVDTVLYFEGDGNSRYRILRAFKNRYGAVNELGMFVMTEKGLKVVSSPSAMLLEGGDQRDAAGRVVMLGHEGTRPLLIELQALVTQSHAGIPRRLCLGMDPNRLSLLLAVLQRHAAISLHDQDVFVNLVGGLKINETAADLAALLALVSSFYNRPIAKAWAVFGEIGLTGEVRPLRYGQERVREAVKHGFKHIIVPGSNRCHKVAGGILYEVNTLGDALEAAGLKAST